MTTNLHRRIAADAFKDKSQLVCDECGATQPLDQDKCAAYLAHGWPKCCGRTMKFEKITVESCPSDKK